MKKRKLYLLVLVPLIWFSLMPVKAKASHAAGGELIYEWISDSTYRFFFKFYRDCTGIAPGGPWNLCATPTCTPSNPSLQAFSQPMQLWTGVLPGGGANCSPVVAGCSNAKTKCETDTSKIPGFWECWYSTIVTLPGQCNFWTFKVAVNARNIASNITGGTGDLYVETTFNNLFFQGNSSPYFSIKPIPYVCVNSPFSYNNGAIDPNGDSLVTDLVQPRYETFPPQCPGNPQPCGMATGFSLPSNPFPTGNTFVVNPQTGQLNFTATTQGPYTLATRVREYRQGFLIGYIIRDVQVQVMVCSPIIPSLAPVSSSVQGGQIQNGTAYGCVNQTLSFCFDVKSADPLALLKAEDNHAQSMPAATVTYSAQAKDSIRGCFSWTPGLKDTGLKGFIVTIKDSTCRPPGIMLFYTITVPVYIWPPTRAFKDTCVCPGQTAFLAAVGGGNFQWSVLPGGSPIGSLNNPNIFNPVAKPFLPTSYVVTSTINPYCGNTTKDTVHVCVLPAPLFSKLADVITCPHNAVKLDLLPTPPSGVTYTYKWKSNKTPSYLSNDTISNPITNPFEDRTYYVTLGTTSGICQDFDTVTIDVLDGFLVENIDTQVCDGESVKIRATGDPRYTYTWLTDPLSGATLSGPNSMITDIKQGNVGKYQYNLKASYVGCTDSVWGFNIETQPIPTVTVDADSKVCFGDTMKMQGLVTPGNYKYNLKWSPGAALDKDDILTPIFSANQAGEQTLVFKAFSSAGCSDSDDVKLTVFPADFLSVSSDTAICSGDSVQVHLKAIGVQSFKWIPDINISNKVGLDPYVWPAATQTYRIYGIDTNGCADTAKVKVTVKPAARIDMPDTVKLYPGESYHMQPGGNALYYSWFPPLGLNKTNISNPIMRPDVNTRYFVTARTEEGCSTSGSVDVIVIPDTYIDVPNAFSPGGPNGNLKPVHLGTATLKSFAVYNRWGVKMFETKDLNSGWDGKFNNEPQPMGVYVYYIEATSPSGKVFKKKGDVTLLR